MILADTSVWIDHFRALDGGLSASLNAARVAIHPFVVGEIACGTLRRRGEVLGLLRRLPVLPVVTDPEALEFIERRSLMGRGIGYVDVHLLASAALHGSTRVWTRDKRLAPVAAELDLSFSPVR